MLRHPLEMCISMFFFSRRRRNIDLEKQKPEKVYDDLEKFIMNKKNYTKFIFDIETESQIPEKLTQYAFIGVTEKFEESCQLLAGMINISTSFNQSFFNKTKRTSAVRDIINKNYGNLMSAHQEFNDDYSIYNYALNKLKNC
ncbi:hypothetical protein KR52_12875 [Synechococcus sp. KORDI-52]|nr:hypothetical protein KR52_12875 [Synechococcus sp. KORDI-52]